MKKEVKKMKTGWIVFLIIVTCMFQPGCDIRNYVYTDSSLKWIAQRSLKKKYGEEFVIYRVWDKSQKMFFATCSPKDDPEVVFEGYFYKTGDNGGVIKDGYAQGVVAKEVNDILKNDIQELFGGCYTHSVILNYINVPEFKNSKEVTIREYMSKVNLDNIVYYIFVPLAAESEDKINNEYELFSKTIQSKIENGIIPDLSVHIFFADNEMIKQCEEYYSTQVYIYYDFGRELDDCESINFKYENGIMDMDYAEYENLRKTLYK